MPVKSVTSLLDSVIVKILYKDNSARNVNMGTIDFLNHMQRGVEYAPVTWVGHSLVAMRRPVSIDYVINYLLT